MISVLEIKPGEANFVLFEKFPFEIYPEDSVRLKFPDSINHTYLQHCFIVIKDDKICARASIYNNPDLYYKEKHAVCVGNYESVNDNEVASALFKHIFSQAKKYNVDFIIGPMNGSSWDNYRFSIHHNYPNFFLEPYHHLYYNEQFLQAGFEVVSKYFSSIDSTLNFDDAFVVERENELKNEGVSFRNINLNDYENELKKLHAFNETAFKSNLFYTPINVADFLNKYVDVKKIINPEFVIFAEDKNKNLLGYFFCIDDFLNTKEKFLITKTIARHPDKQWKNLGHVIGNMIQRKAVQQNYTSIIHAFMNESGTSTTISKDFFGEKYKNYVLYIKEVK